MYTLTKIVQNQQPNARGRVRTYVCAVCIASARRWEVVGLSGERWWGIDALQKVQTSEPSANLRNYRLKK